MYQIWVLGDKPEYCMVYISALKLSLNFSKNKDILDDISIIMDLLETHEKVGTLPTTKEELGLIVSQYYNEKNN